MQNPNEFPKKLASVILQHRKKSGMSRAELAGLSGVGKTQIFELEHGKETIQLDTLLKVLRVLNIQLAFSSPLLNSTLTETK